jgi:protein TonB
MTGARRFLAALVAAAVSTALHASGLLVLAPASGVRMQGGAGAEPARLGDGFADLAAGTLAPVGQGALIPQAPVTPTALAAPAPGTVAAPVAAPIAPSEVTPPVTPPLSSATAASSAPAGPALTAPALAVTETARVPAGEAAPEGEAVSALSVEPAPVVWALAAPALPSEARETAAAPVPDRLVARDADMPQTRPRARPAPRTAPGPAKTEPAAEAPALARGNSDRNERSGAATGTGDTGGITTQGQGAVASAAGNGAVENYGGKVMRRILKTRKVRAPSAGLAVIGFAIAPDGRLADLRVLRSSGSADLDAVALDHLRRAQPFPRPPPGARRDWSFEFVGQD